jgi:RHS repeat-associated protein
MLPEFGILISRSIFAIPLVLRAHFTCIPFGGILPPGTNRFCECWDDQTLMLFYNPLSGKWEGSTEAICNMLVILKYNCSDLGDDHLEFTAGPYSNSISPESQSTTRCAQYMVPMPGANCTHPVYDFILKVDIDNPIGPCPRPKKKCIPCAQMSQGPVIYATGEPLVTATDIASNGFGESWGYSRSYASQLEGGITNVATGYNWQTGNLPYLILTDTGTVILMRGPNQTVWFDDDGSEFVPRMGVRLKLIRDKQNRVMQLVDLDGTVTFFSDVSGVFLERRDPGGNQLKLIARDSINQFSITQMERSYTDGDGNTVVEQMSYNIPDGNNMGIMDYITLRRQINGGDWTNVQRAFYEYYIPGPYDPEINFGNNFDLSRVTTEVWQDESWVRTSQSAYRYYLLPPPDEGDTGSSSSSSGLPPIDPRKARLLKYVLQPAAYDRMVADGHDDPLHVSNSIFALYADFYFEYDENRRVTLERINGASQTFEFDYVDSPFLPDTNVWSLATSETRQDGSVKIVYTNAAGQTMLEVLNSFSDNWYTYSRLDTNNQPILVAAPSAMLGFDDSYPDLVHQSLSGHYEYLKDDEGLIQTFSYHPVTGAVTSSHVQKGQLGASIPVHEYEFVGRDWLLTFDPAGSSSSSSSSSSSAAGTLMTTYFPSRQIDYPDDGTDCECCAPSSSSSSMSSSSSGALRQIVTSFDYLFYPSSPQPSQLTTTLPVISTDQNGSGVAETRKMFFNTYGLTTWVMDERGFIGRIEYDIPTGAVIQQVADVDTSLYDDVPDGWTTPASGGLNLVTDMTPDIQGRIIQALGPRHTIDVDGTAIEIRRAAWSVYDDGNHISYTGQGFAEGTDPDYDYTLINPVAILKMDADGKVLEQIQATAPATSGTLPEIIDAAGGGVIAFPQTSYTRWTTNQYTDCCLLESQRVYHTIPDAGTGSSGTNYDETGFGYDVMKRRNRTVTPGGTITELDYDVRSLVTSVSVGVIQFRTITVNQYDGGLAGGDGNLTQVTEYVDDSTTRVTSMSYDFRNRRVTTDGEIDLFECVCYDNLDRVIRTDRRDTSLSGNLIGRSAPLYDDRSRVYRTLAYEVDPATGAVGNCLTSDMWYDPSGNLVKSLPAGSKLFTKTTFDSLGRPAAIYNGYDLGESSYADAFTVTDDVILEQAETVFDNAGNAIQVTARQRYHNAVDTQTGPLQDPDTTPKARVTYAASYPDPLGRVVAMANYGTNGGTALTRSATIPTASDTILVNLTRYDDAGNVYEMVDPIGTVTRLEFDDAGRKTTLIENYQSVVSSSSSSGGGCDPSDDVNRETQFTYNPDGFQATLTAINGRTGNQTTTWTYGVDLSNSNLQSTLLLRSVAYPDSTGGSDVVSYSYNRQSEQTMQTDQRGCVHELEYDALGRPAHDRVTTVGDGVDDAVLRLSAEYEVRGMVATLTSWNDAEVGAGDVVNQVQWTFNGFRQSIQTFQSHSGAVNTSTTPSVGATYADGSLNTIRPTGLIYPNGRVVSKDYGSAGSLSDAANLISSLVDSVGSTSLAEMQYLGLGAVVRQDSPEADLQYTLINLAGGNDPDTGDIYSGWDRFTRVKDSRWRNSSTDEDLSRVQYGYNRASSRIWRANLSDPDRHYDWLYGYDGLQRLKNAARGTLGSGNTSITDAQFGQCWSLDPTGNWHGFRQNDTGSGWSLIQSRTSNPVNEITEITNSTGPAWANPTYDAAGNMTTIPRDQASGFGWGSLTKQQWGELSINQSGNLPVDPETPGKFTATYDAWNRLVGLKDAITDDTLQENRYDARNYRVRRDDYSGGTLNESRHFYYTDAWRCVEERLGSTPDSADPDRQFVWGVRYIDDLVCRDRSVDGVLDERLYSCQDANWSVTTVVDTAGAVQERYAYDPYGKSTVITADFGTRSASDFDWETRHTGNRLDLSTKLSPVRNRFYHSTLGQWINRDPIGYADGANLYSAYFVPSDTDPFGLEATHWDATWWNFLTWWPFGNALDLTVGNSNWQQSGIDSAIKEKERELWVRLETRVDGNARVDPLYDIYYRRYYLRPIPKATAENIQTAETFVAGSYGDALSFAKLNPASLGIRRHSAGMIAQQSVGGAKSINELKNIANFTPGRLQHGKHTCSLHASRSALEAIDALPERFAVGAELRAKIRSQHGLNQQQIIYFVEALDSKPWAISERGLSEEGLIKWLSRGSVISLVDGNHWVHVTSAFQRQGHTWVRIVDSGVGGSYDQLFTSYMRRHGENTPTILIGK